MIHYIKTTIKQQSSASPSFTETSGQNGPRAFRTPSAAYYSKVEKLLLIIIIIIIIIVTVIIIITYIYIYTYICAYDNIGVYIYIYIYMYM